MTDNFTGLCEEIENYYSCSIIRVHPNVQSFEQHTEKLGSYANVKTNQICLKILGFLESFV